MVGQLDFVILIVYLEVDVGEKGAPDHCNYLYFPTTIALAGPKKGNLKIMGQLIIVKGGGKEMSFVGDCFILLPSYFMFFFIFF